MINSIWTLIFLSISTVLDIKKRMVCPVMCFINIGAAIIINYFLQSMSWTYLLLGIGLGGVFFLVSLCTGEAIGKGDALIIMAVGSMEGVLVCFEILIYAFLLCTAVSVAALILKRARRGSSLPFVPFILAGEVIVFIMERG